MNALLAERRVTLKSAAQIDKMAVAGRLVADVLDRLESEVRAGL
jgi:methionine aminopeptidase